MTILSYNVDTDEIYSTYPQYLLLLEVKVNGCKQKIIKYLEY